MMILDGFIEGNWKITESKDEVVKKLPTGYTLGKKGEVRKKR
jgi:hypothetical protein